MISNMGYFFTWKPGMMKKYLMQTQNRYTKNLAKLRPENLHGQTIDRKNITLLSCIHICPHLEHRGYVLVTRDSVYVLNGHRSDLDKFGGGRATITGRVDVNTVLVVSVSSVKNIASFVEELTGAEHERH